MRFVQIKSTEVDAAPRPRSADALACRDRDAVPIEPMTLDGVRSLAVSCWQCHHEAILNVETWPRPRAGADVRAAHGLRNHGSSSGRHRFVDYGYVKAGAIRSADSLWTTWLTKVNIATVVVPWGWIHGDNRAKIARIRSGARLRMAPDTPGAARWAIDRRCDVGGMGRHDWVGVIASVR
jgi:hypothetical protein